MNLAKEKTESLLREFAAEGSQVFIVVTKTELKGKGSQMAESFQSLDSNSIRNMFVNSYFLISEKI